MKPFDLPLLSAVIGLQMLGFMMLSSASLYRAEALTHNPFFFLERQAVFIILAWGFTLAVLRIKMQQWEKNSAYLYLLGLGLLGLVLVVGKNTNGSTRWLDFGIFSLQVSELMKLFVILYLARFLVQHQTKVKTQLRSLLGPLVLLLITAVLLLAEPDLGATAVILVTALGLFFIGGVALRGFLMLLGAAVIALITLIAIEPYRLRRITGFLHPWDSPFGDSFQLIQSLIAFGRGEWAGVGFGNSIQKLLYLPEAHTDFLLAILGEELGLLGVIAVIFGFGVLIWRAFVIASRAELAGSNYAAYVAYGIGLWLGLQAIINMGVTLGMLPTKGLTLPLMSYGGSSTLVVGIAVGLLLRIDDESRQRASIHPIALVDDEVGEEQSMDSACLTESMG